MRIVIEYLEGNNGPVPLLNSLSRTRIENLIETRTAEAKKIRLAAEEAESDDLVLTAIRLESEIRAAEKELAIDLRIRQERSEEIHEAVIEFEDATIADLGWLSDIAATEKNPEKLTRHAYQRLKPKRVNGELERIPVRLYPLVRQACWELFYPSLSEEKQAFFSTS